MKILLVIAAGLAIVWVDWFFSPERRLYQVVTEMVGRRTALIVLGAAIAFSLVVYWMPVILS
jgi:hypothetical protein